jgi:hypothetical protein
MVLARPPQNLVATKPGEYRADSPAVQRGDYDIKDRYLRGSAGGEAHPHYIRSGRGRK